MGFIIEVLRDALLLAAALSVDAFVAAFTYGNSKIKIPLLSSTIISAVCCSMVAISLFLGKILMPFMPEDLAASICFAILFILGVVKLFESGIKAFIRKRRVVHSSIGFSFSGLHFLLDIYADPIEADKDLSNSLSPSEAVALAIALSVDGLAAGFGVSLAGNGMGPIVIITFLFTLLTLKGGEWLGHKISAKSEHDLSWISGVLLLILAFIKL